jgi:predicted alpha/beta-hydrolase family hydrolase
MSFIAAFAEGLAAAEFRVMRFEFQLLAHHRQPSKQRPAEREPVL